MAVDNTATHVYEGAPEYASREELLAALVPPLKDKLNVEADEIVESASFTDDLNADSLDMVEVLMIIDEDFHVHIADEDAQQLKTVGDALDFLEPFLVKVA